MSRKEIIRGYLKEAYRFWVWRRGSPATKRIGTAVNVDCYKLECCCCTAESRIERVALELNYINLCFTANPWHCDCDIFRLVFAEGGEVEQYTFGKSSLFGVARLCKSQEAVSFKRLCTMKRLDELGGESSEQVKVAVRIRPLNE